MGWRHTPEDWHVILEAGKVLGFRSAAGTIAASAALFPYGRALASIGMVVTKPSCQRRGLGLALMRKILASLPAPRPPFTLIATEQGEPLYRRLGFKTIAHVQRLQSDKHPSKPMKRQSTRSPSPLAEDDFEAICRLDAEATGADRRALLEVLRRRASISMVRGRGGIAAFAFCLLRRERLVVGPVIALDHQAAAAVILDLRARHEGILLLDVPTQQSGLTATLEAAGFQSGGTAPVMLLGSAALPGHRKMVAAVASRAFG
ncbi:MAG: GNAT family N-acetyltransferase [Elusimicrobia bacterium]|nr:GNAT family N-acetyltransferase [Elusimicrobiota bacterium]